MKYNPKLTKQICEELKKMPNVRYVCKKVGIDHSTYYRWLSRHFSFYKETLIAQEMGRDMINDAAEGVIINGIQSNDRKSAIYWLSHNKARYAGPKQARYLEGINDNLIKLMDEEPKPGETAFEKFYDLYYETEKTVGPELAKKVITRFVSVVFHDDPEVQEIFFATYQGWKADKEELDKRIKDAFPED